MSFQIILAAIVVFALSGFPGLFLSVQPGIAQRISAFLGVIAGGSGLGASIWCLMSGTVLSLKLPWSLLNDPLQAGLDPLSAFFLIPIFLLGGMGPLYGLRYWYQSEHPRPKTVDIFWGFLVAGMGLLVVSQHAIVFLMGWEIMAISAFFLINTDHHQEEVRKAAWLYLIATHIGTLALIAMFCLLSIGAETMELKPIPADNLSIGMMTAIFLLALLGFGLKAGLMPLHFWLPSAHANAPSHVSAILSGVMIKMGVYGLVRITGILPPPPLSWGILLLIVSVISGILGVAFAIGQHDIKRLLAYHSVENIGIIVMGLGLALLGRCLHQPTWIMLGLGGCLLHVWNHCFFKSLLFLSAGEVIHTTHTRHIDSMGGMVKVLPYTAFFFLIGSIAICGLPPLNGFISEFLIYMGLFHTIGLESDQTLPVVALIAPALAIIGALALACFVKVFGIVFLGMPRQTTLRSQPSRNPTMLIPMVILTLCCIAIGLFPWLLAVPLNNSISAWTKELSENRNDLVILADLRNLGWLNLSIWVAIMTLTAFLYARYKIRSARRVPTWDCGYAHPSPRMQYTASSFAQLLVEYLRWPLRPKITEQEVHGIFPDSSRFESHIHDPVLDEVILPAAINFQRVVQWLRSFHQGLIQTYILYILIAIIALFAWMTPFNQILAKFWKG